MYVFTYRFKQSVLKYDIVVLADTHEQADRFLREQGVDEIFIKTAVPEQRRAEPGVIYTS